MPYVDWGDSRGNVTTKGYTKYDWPNHTPLISKLLYVLGYMIYDRV